MKVAIVHDYIKEFGGAERVLEELHRLFPDAPIYTSIYAPEYLGPHRESFEKMEIHASFLNYIPYREKLISVLRLLSPFAFWSFYFKDTDVVIVSQTGAYFPNLSQKGAKTKLICYTHTPPRYLYGYRTAREIQPGSITGILSAVVFHFFRMLDFKSSENVDYFIANSEEIRSRIQKFYRRDAVVINPPATLARALRAGPPVDIPSHPPKATRSASSGQARQKPEYYLAGGRLARAKGIDIILDAFIKNGKHLKIFGRGFAGFEQKLKSKIEHQRSKIQFVGEVSDTERQELMANAKAYVFASFDEDFGITPVEAMAVGTPVIAFKSGGVKETVIDPSTGSGQVATGIFFDENTPEAINEAVKKFEKTKISSDACRKQAQKFSAEVFDKKIREYISNIAG